MKEENNIIIVGAGISGLVAAIELEKKGYSTTILEASDRVGGRVKTDYQNGYQFDHGFQVLLIAYPELKKYLNLEALKLRYFMPGARIYRDTNIFMLADPLRQPSALFSAIFSPAGSLWDKWRIWRLSVQLKQMTVEEIFEGPSITTMEYLKYFGFSDTIITNFFQPFFAGIFLEKELETSSRMFQFIFKMFSEGYAAIPEKGMQAIPDQLFSQLRKTKIHYNVKVEAIKDKVLSTSKDDFNFDAVIFATDPDKILSRNSLRKINYRSTVNLYFSIPSQKGDGYIGLIPTNDSLINNISILTDVASTYASNGLSLLSVSIVGSPQVMEEQLIHQITDELTLILKLNSTEIIFLKSYHISQALPEVENPVMTLTRNQLVGGNGIYFAGDYLLGGSLNGAMVSGRQCAELLAEDLSSN
ncbi:MAG: phytoene dehydrogenase-like protein [Cyclobacteriaceae bacterium]|jgi:phytoene dehydrogenase-like protein